MFWLDIKAGRFAAWCMEGMILRVVTAKQMKEIEANSLAWDLTYGRLMENAGAAAAAFIRRTFRVEGLNCMVFCGRGNNGGDGLVVARKLYENGANVVVVLVDGIPSSDEAQGMFESVEAMELPLFRLPEDAAKIESCVQQADIVVDAIYGTGFHGELEGNAQTACGFIADAIAAVVALDLPSGVACDTGHAAKGAVQADFTVAFDCLKPVHVVPSGLVFCGKVETVEIGIPPEAHAGIESFFSDITTEMVFDSLPQRPAECHKGDFGVLLAICGSTWYRGAAVLAAMGALSCGAGICRIASVEAACSAVAAALPEPVYLPLPQNEGGGIDAEASAFSLRSAMKEAAAILLGCGCQNTDDTTRLLELVLRGAKVPVLLDADGINALSGNINVLQEANVPVILTPHPGEMARLCGCSTEEVQADRMGTAMRFATKHKVILVLKGAGTIVAAPDGRLWFNHTGGPGLAKGGSGDVLAGMLGALLAQGLAPELAAVCAVHLHGLAGERAAARQSDYGMLPSALPEDIRDILLSYRR